MSNQQTQQGMNPNIPQTPIKSTSGLTIAALVLGIIAIATSFLPIINNLSFFIALLGLIFGIVGVVQSRGGKRKGFGMAVASVVLNILACVIVVASQSFYGAVLDEVSNDLGGNTNASVNEVSASSTTSTEATSSSQSAQSDNLNNLAIGTSVDVGSGMTVSVNSVTDGITNYSGDPLVCVNVTYTNNSSETGSFGIYDWKVEDASGVQSTPTIYFDAASPLNSGDLSAGGTVTGDVYFEGAPTKIIYLDNIFMKDKTISWVL